MRVKHGFVLMDMAVRPCRHGLMQMVVMPIVMTMGMFMRHDFMRVIVLMGFHQMQHDARQHQQAAQAHQSAG